MAQKPDLVIKGISKKILRAMDESLKPSFTKKFARVARDMIVKRTRLGFGVDRATGNQKRLVPLSKAYKKVRAGKLQFFTNKKTNKIFTVVPGKKKKKSKGASSRARKAAASRAAKKFKTVFELGSFKLGGSEKSKKRKKPGKKALNRLKRLSSKTSPGKSNLTATGGMLNSIKFKGLKNKILIEIPDSGHGPDLFGNKVDLSHAELAKIQQNGRLISHPSGIKIKIPKRRFFDLTKAEKNKIIRLVRQTILKKYRK